VLVKILKGSGTPYFKNLHLRWFVRIAFQSDKNRTSTRPKYQTDRSISHADGRWRHLETDLMKSANAALGVKGNRPLNNPRPRRYAPGPRKSSCLLAAAEPCSLRGLGRCDARARCTTSFGRLALRHSFDFMAFKALQWATNERRKAKS
jgi:hypothetical protein